MKRLLITLACVGIASAQTDPAAAPPRVGVGITERKLSLDDTIRMALSNNLDIEIERTNKATAEQAVEQARGAYDPAFRYLPFLETRNTPTGSLLQGSSGKLTDRFLNQNFSLAQRLERGTLLQFDFDNGRQTTTNPFTSFTPLITSRLAFTFTQPLLRGFRDDRQRAEIKIRRRQVDESAIDIEMRVIEVIARTEQAYWDLVAARQDVTVRADNVEWAREQLAANQRLVKAGTLAPVELSAAEAELQRRLDTYYAALGAVTEVENALKSLIAPERAASIWGDQIIPAEEGDAEQPQVDNVREAVALALSQRPELRAVGVRQEINAVEKDLNDDLRKPQLNLVAQYSLNGLGGTVREGENPFSSSQVALYNQLNLLSARSGLPSIPPPSGLSGAPPGFLVGGYGASLSNLTRYQSFQAGLQFDLNLRNRSANAAYGQSLVAAKRLKLERTRTEQAIEAQVRNSLQAIETARQRIAAADASARAAREKLDSEMRLFQTGESTNFLVLTRQNEYADSRRRAVVSRLELNKGIARLEQAVGSTLSAHKVIIDR